MQTTNISNSFKNTPIYNRNIFLILSLLTMVAIFVLSSFPGNESNQMSDLPATIIADPIPSLSEFSVLIARKMAHFAEYMVLGFFMALYTHGSKKELAIVFLVGCLLFRMRFTSTLCLQGIVNSKMYSLIRQVSFPGYYRLKQYENFF